MKTDVQTLIAALTTERNSLNRAIAALEQITPVAVKTAAKEPPKRRRHRTHLDVNQKSAILTALRDGASPVSVARSYGVSPQTVYQGRRRWTIPETAVSNNGDDSVQ